MENPLLTSSLLRPLVGTTKSYVGTSSLLAKSSLSSSALSSSLFGTSLSTKRRAVSRPGADREDEARVAKLKKEADQLRLGLSKEKTNMSLRSSLLLSSHGVPLGGSTHGGLLGGTGSQRLTNPLLTNPLLSTTSGLLSTGAKLTQTVTSTSKVKATKRKVMVAKEAPKVKLPRPATAPAKAKQAKASRNLNTKMASRNRKVERLEAEPMVPTVSEMPEYDLDLGELVGDVGFDLETFLSMAEDPDLEITRPLVDIQSVKVSTKAVHKNNYISGLAAGWLKKVRLEKNKIHFCNNKKIPSKMDNIFQSTRKKNKIAAARLATILATRWTGNTFFYGQPKTSYGLPTKVLKGLRLFYNEFKALLRP